MTHPDPSPTGGSGRDGVTLRLLRPQWQGAGTSSVEALAPELPLGARRGYAVGAAVLEAQSCRHPKLAPENSTC